MEYARELVEKLCGPGAILDIQGVPVECKAVPDGPAGVLDPRELDRQLKLRQTPAAPMTLQEERDSMGGFNYNLNRKEIWTKYLLVPTSQGEVPVWCYYPRHMGQGRPALVYAHGGAFLGGSVFTVENPCKLIAERAGCVVWNVDYSLPPEHPYPIPCTQVYEAAKYLHSHAEEYGVNPDRIMAAGDSAGGNLAAAAAQMDRDQGTGCLAGQILLYAKLTFSNNALPGYVRDEHAFAIAAAQKGLLPDLLFIGSDPSNRRDEEFYVQGRYDIRTPYISPAFGPAEGLPRALLILAEYDGLRLEGEYYAKKLLEAGVPVRTIRYCGMAHGFFDGLGILPQAEAAVNEIAAFLQQ